MFKLIKYFNLVHCFRSYFEGHQSKDRSLIHSNKYATSALPLHLHTRYLNVYHIQTCMLIHLCLVLVKKSFKLSLNWLKCLLLCYEYWLFSILFLIKYTRQTVMLSFYWIVTSNRNIFSFGPLSAKK